MIVNETMARRLWPGESAIGRRFTIWRDEKFPREVVGVVGDTRESLDKEADDEMYVPYAQDAGWGSMSLVVHERADGARGFSARSDSSIDKAVPNYNLKTMNDVALNRRAGEVPMLLLSACGCGDVARDARNLRCHFLLRDAAHARDWCAHGARRADC